MTLVENSEYSAIHDFLLSVLSVITNLGPLWREVRLEHPQFDDLTARVDHPGEATQRELLTTLKFGDLDNLRRS